MVNDKDTRIVAIIAGSWPVIIDGESKWQENYQPHLRRIGRINAYKDNTKETTSLMIDLILIDHETKTLKGIYCCYILGQHNDTRVYGPCLNQIPGMWLKIHYDNGQIIKEYLSPVQVEQFKNDYLKSFEGLDHIEYKINDKLVFIRLKKE